jgi:hypothetical protein
MPIPLLAGAATVLGSFAAGLVFRLLTALGVSIVVWQGLDAIFEGALEQIQLLTSGLPATVSQAIVLMRIDDGIAVIFGGIALRISLKTFGIGGNRAMMLFGRAHGSS